MNPSLTDSAKKSIDECGFNRNKNYKSNEKSIRNLIDYQRKVKFEKPIPYFKAISSFFDEIQGISYKEDVFHYDFMPVRETNSKIVIKELKDKNLRNNLISLFQKVILEVDPKIILICNAALSQILIEEKKIDDINDNGYRYYDNSKPVILANQLSGGATSKVYRDILIWLVRKILKKLVIR